MLQPVCFYLCFSSQKKKSALFEVAEVVPVMTNNYEENILRGVRDSSYSLESSIELLQKDVVQLHAPRYQSMRRVSQSTIWGGFILSKRKTVCVFKLFSLLTGCDRLHTGDGLHPLATQRHWEDCVSAVLQMEGGRWWTLSARSGQIISHYVGSTFLEPGLASNYGCNFLFMELLHYFIN